ncbi:MAG: sugar ABC transporter substrate-binding protein [Mycobacterium sp.]
MSRRTLIKAGAAGVVVVGAGGLIVARNVGGEAKTAGVDGDKSAGAHQLLLLTNEWNSIIDDAAGRAAKILGLPYRSTNFDKDDTVALTQAQSAVAAGQSLFLTNSADGSSLPGITAAAAQNGGSLVNVGSSVPWVTPLDIGNAYTQQFTAREDIGFHEAVKEALRQAVAKFGEKLTILHVTGSPGSFDDARRSDSVNRAVAEFPGARVLGSLPGNWASEDGQKATEDLIARYGVPNVIVAQNDGSLTGVLAALKGLNIAAGQQVLTVGVDGATDILRAIKEGTVAATAFQSPTYFGVQAMARLFDALNGYDFQAPERLVGFAGITVTKGNVDGVLARYVDNENLPFDPKLLSHVISGDKWDPQAPLAPLKIDEFYASQPKPAGYQLPAAYTESIKSGAFDEITQQYAKAYRLKLDDFGYQGVQG